MFLLLIGFMLLGIGVGVITGLIPGVHPNTVFIISLSLSTVLLSFGLLPVLVFIVSLAVSNTFTDFLPSILFGAPEPDSALSVLPGHKFLMEGRGYEALFLTTLGGFGVVLLTILTLPLLLYLIPFIYDFIYSSIHVILLIIVAWMIFTETGKDKIYALLAFLLVGVFGLITINSFPSSFSLFPAFTGLFAFSTLVVSFYNKTTIPPQTDVVNVTGGGGKGIVTGWLAGMLAGLLPGIGAAQAGIIAAQTLKTEIKDFLIALGGINTANIIFTLVVFYTIGKTRSGAVWTISQITDTLIINDMIVLMVVAATTCFISVIITLKIGKFLVKRMVNINYNKLTLAIITGLVLLVLIFTGPIGVLIAITGTFIGLFTIIIGIKRTHLMGFLILPTILYFSGYSYIISSLLGL
ncbi:MAG: tripartite tricarboxylate transporter permease [Nanoarchaeota archaeon]